METGIQKMPKTLKKPEPAGNRSQAGLETGVFLLSLDVELAWGTFDHGGLHTHADDLKQVRPLVHRLLELLDEYAIPATFAVVGHLFLDSCERTDGTTHPEVGRPKYDWFDDDWHCLDPGTDVRRDPLWYAPDIIDAIQAAGQDHEIGTHTFSHIIVDDPACTPEIFASQITACAALHKQRGLPLKSIVYPRDRPAHLDVLRDCGLTNWRGREEAWYGAFTGRMHRFCHLLHRTLAFPPPTYGLTNRVQDGLVNLPSSILLMPCMGIRRFIPMASRLRQARLGIRKAVRLREIFHLWSHPFNLASDERLFGVLERVLAEVRRLADSGQLMPMTMSGLAEQLLERQPQATARWTQ